MWGRAGLSSGLFLTRLISCFLVGGGGRGLADKVSDLGFIGLRVVPFFLRAQAEN